MEYQLPPPETFTCHLVLLYPPRHGDIIGEPDTIHSYAYFLLRVRLVFYHMFFSNLLDYEINSRHGVHSFQLMGNWLVTWRYFHSFFSRPKGPRADHEEQPILIDQILIIQ